MGLEGFSKFVLSDPSLIEQVLAVFLATCVARTDLSLLSDAWVLVDASRGASDHRKYAEDFYDDSKEFQTTLLTTARPVTWLWRPPPSPWMRRCCNSRLPSKGPVKPRPTARPRPRRQLRLRSRWRTSVR